MGCGLMMSGPLADPGEARRFLFLHGALFRSVQIFGLGPRDVLKWRDQPVGRRTVGVLHCCQTGLKHRIGQHVGVPGAIQAGFHNFGLDRPPVAHPALARRAVAAHRPRRLGDLQRRLWCLVERY